MTCIGQVDLILDDLLETGGTKREVRSGLAMLRRIAMIETEETRSGGKRHRLLRRYVQEARAQRRRSFEAWAAARAREAAAAARRTPDSRNKASMQPQAA